MPIEIWYNGSHIQISKPLCGAEWLREHFLDHTHAEIEALTIEVSHDGRAFATVKANNSKGTVKDLVKLRRGGENGKEFQS